MAAAAGLPPILANLMKIPEDDEDDLLRLGPFTQGYCTDMVDFAKEQRKKKKVEQIEIYRERDRKKRKLKDCYEWSDRDTSFKYTLCDMPVLDTRGKSKVIPMQITRFERLDDCSAIMTYPRVLNTRRRLCNEITNYCLGIPPDYDFVPDVGQLIFVKIPTWAEIESSIRYEHLNEPKEAEKWLEKNRELHDPDVEDADSHHWTRAIFLEKIAEDCPRHRCNAFLVELVDFGRNVPVIRYNVRSAIYRFVPFPAMAVRLCIFVNRLTQYTNAVHRKWKQILRPGTHLEMRLLVDCEFQLVMNLHNPTEEELEAMTETKDESRSSSVVSAYAPMKAKRPEKKDIVKLPLYEPICCGVNHYWESEDTSPYSTAQLQENAELEGDPNFSDEYGDSD